VHHSGRLGSLMCNQWSTRGAGMAKRKEQPKVKAIKAPPKRKLGSPVRLELSDEVHEELEREAKMRGLNKASLSRMIVLEWLREQKAKGVQK